MKRLIDERLWIVMMLAALSWSTIVIGFTLGAFPSHDLYVL